MRLKSFRVTNFRSIKDSGEIDVSRITALLGRNESGKSNILKGLYSLNPLTGFKELNPVKDFPRDRRLDECKDDTKVVSTTWELDEDDKKGLLDVLPRATEVSRVTIARSYGKTRTVGFQDLAPIAFDTADITSRVKKVSAGIRAKATDENALGAAADNFEAKALNVKVRETWAEEFETAAKDARIALAKADTELTETQEGILSALENLGVSIAGDEEAQQEARNWAVGAIPKFFYLDEYPELDGHQSITEFLNRKQNNQSTDADRNFEKLSKVASLEPARLQDLQNKGDAEQRNQLANRASAVVTSEVRRLWKDRELKIRFNLDGAHFDTLISDPTATYDVEVNLNDRSRGFQWFFAFYVTFAADTDGGKVGNAILLLVSCPIDNFA